ncbi:MAG: MMPL family transporter [Lachnospiraceae bacterium]|uniref:efflux RND transporter permease subunit n=1 Tax=Candidatus Merdisoma sp. JLR.KK011 TaxID=3114299 RepID=UPI0014343D73|nr:MMPL family transporter [Lachnospiraceae bacterium]MCI9623511.1 MMPL family transporter [Lachnospiraceae bacterium]GFI10186.1 membrane protein YdfJ [Lachnospiraceae bacterium]
MIKFGKGVVKLRIPILILTLALMIPSALGMAATRINYDMLTYLPGDIETMIGQDILMDEFGKGAFSFVIIEGMEDKEVAELRERIEEVDHVATVLWYDSFMDLSVPMEILPDEYYDIFNSGNATMMAVFFETSTSADETLDAAAQIKELAGEQCFVSGMTAMVADLKELCEREEVIYVVLAVVLSSVVMTAFLDSLALPVIFLISIGMAILLNMGTNIFFGEISFLTQALAAVLQLAVTMDYSIFLWHSYVEQQERFEGDKKRAMAHAIKATITSVVGSSITTVAGFIALCFMSYTLGLDLGLVMAKGVVFGVLGCVTILPSMILVLDRFIEKTRHRPLMPDFGKIVRFVVKRYPVFLILFVLVLPVSYYGYNKAGGEVYYNLGGSLPEYMGYVQATNKLEDEFSAGATHMVLLDKNVSAKDVKNMVAEMKEVEGVEFALGMDSAIGSRIPDEMIPDKAREELESENWKLLLIQSKYSTATDEVNMQITKLQEIMKKYDETGMLIGEAPCTKDLIEITDRDFQVVNTISIIAIFVIIAAVLKSISLPVILVAVIEFAIFINLGIPHFTGTSLPFIAPICISTIQLGATVDYAILMTTRYKRERFMGQDRVGAISTALETSLPSVIVSALGFFAATLGVAVYSDVDMIRSLCALMARGAIVSLLAVAFILPAMFLVFDRLICATSAGFRPKKSA